MAENEIQILIKAVDEATATLKKIENQVTKTASNSKEANDRLSSSFTKVQGAMLNLGQIAQGIHNIFETQERVTRNLENAQDRLENATIRLKNAQESLNDIEKKHLRDSLTLERATLENARAQEDLKYYTDRLATGVTFTGQTLRDYEDAQIRAKEAAFDLSDAQNLSKDKAEELKKAQDDLTIAQNGVDRATRQLQKTTEDAKWAYLDMGVQVLTVAGNIYALKTAFSVATGVGGLASFTTATTTATSAIGTGATATAAGTGLIGAIGGLAIVLGTLSFGGYIKQLGAESEAYNSWGGAIDTTKQKLVDLDEQMKATTGLGGTRQTSQVWNQVLNTETGQLETPKTQTAGQAYWEGGLPGLIKYLTQAKDKTKEAKDKLDDFSNVAMPNMSASAKTNVGQVVVELNRIPKDIYTYHHIITVYDSGGKK